MFGIILFILYIIIGVYLSFKIFSKHKVYIGIWAGIVIGIVSFMWFVIPFAFLFGFTIMSHIIGFIVYFLTVFIIDRLFYKATSIAIMNCFNIKNNNLMIFLITIGIISAILIYILFTHTIVPKDGSLHVGQSTYGDLAMHLGFITSIATQETFPPEYSIFPGVKLCYPFLIDSLSSSLYLFGIPLRWSIILPSIIILISIVCGFYFICQELLKRKWGIITAMFLFFFNGGFGFIYFLDGLKNGPENFIRIFTEYYQTPTNLIDKNIRWTNIICDMLIPQRTFMAGWFVLLFVIWLLIRAIKDKDKIYFLIGGILTGLLPMIHTHTFLGLGILLSVWFIIYFFEEKNKLEYIKNWLYFGIPVILLSFPQLFYWTLSQATSDNFIRYGFDWANDKDIWIWFWFKNVGVVFILLIPAIISSKKRNVLFYLGSAVLFVISDYIVFQPNPYDNNKLFLIWYAFSVIFVTVYLEKSLERINRLKEKYAILAIILFFGVFSGLLSIGREIVSEYELFSSEQVKAAEFIKANTPPDSLFASDNNHNNTISCLTGRNIILGSPIFLYYHGYNINDRQKSIEQLFRDIKYIDSFKDKYKIDYLYFSDYEKNKYKTNISDILALYPLIYNSGDIYIFAVSKRSIEFAK